MKFSLICVPLLLLAAAARAMDPAPTEKPKSDPAAGDVQKAQQFARQLSSDSFTERITAQKELLQLGRASIEPLEYAAHSEDSEARLRANELLIALRGRGFMGIGLSETDPDEEEAPVADDKPKIHKPSVLVNQLPSFEDYKAYGVTREFPAKAGGIEVQDRIISINGRPVAGVKDLMREVINIGPGRTAVALIQRGDQKFRFPMMLARNHVLLLPSGQPVSDPAPPVDLEKEMEQANPKVADETKKNILDEPAKVIKEVEDDVRFSQRTVRNIKKLKDEIKVEVKKAEGEAKKQEETDKKAAEVKKKDEDTAKK